MEITSQLKYAPIGVMKANLVARALKGKDINRALNVLSFSQKKASPLIKGLLQSAVSNALEKKVLDIDNLYIKTILVNQAPSLKRFLPRAQGRASPIRKRRSHITLVLDERVNKKRTFNNRKRQKVKARKKGSKKDLKSVKKELSINEGGGEQKNKIRENRENRENQENK